MKILVLGATGGLGRQIVVQALEQGHQVTAFARDPSKLATRHPSLKIVQGDILRDASAVDAAVKDQDAVISALGVGESFKPAGLIARSMPIIIRAMESQGVRRLIFTSGIILKLDVVPFVLRTLMRLLMKDLAADKKAGEDVLRTTGLDWTLVYPTRMTNGPRTDSYRSGEHVELRGIPRVSRADVAHLILRLMADSRSFGKDVLVSA